MKTTDFTNSTDCTCGASRAHYPNDRKVGNEQKKLMFRSAFNVYYIDARHSKTYFINICNSWKHNSQVKYLTAW